MSRTVLDAMSRELGDRIAPVEPEADTNAEAPDCYATAPPTDSALILTAWSWMVSTPGHPIRRPTPAENARE